MDGGLVVEPGPQVRRPASMDVAKLAGVSQKTVSRVFNGERYVTEEVRERVLDAAQRLGYRPNRAARALKLERNHVGLAQRNAQATGAGGAQALFTIVITGSLLSIIPSPSPCCCCSGTGRAAWPWAASTSGAAGHPAGPEVTERNSNE